MPLLLRTFAKSGPTAWPESKSAYQTCALEPPPGENMYQWILWKIEEARRATPREFPDRIVYPIKEI